MPKRTTIKPFLSLEQLQARFEQATDPVEQRQWQVIWRLAQAQPVARIAQTSGYSAAWVRELARRYNRSGPAAVGDKRHYAKGATPLIDPAQLCELENLLATTSCDEYGRAWNGPTLTEWIEAKTGRKLARQRGWEYLQRLGFTFQTWS